MHIVGTAGHVDHGKSSLVQALTGTNPDRWLEEQLRGMTLDLGFAQLRFADGLEAGIIDVPGHERFLHNMLAGAAGMELLLLVVAADEGVMPQTIEHLQILRYLNVRSTIVVLTKADLLSVEELEFAFERTRESLRGTLAQHAPMRAVSNRSGSGFDELRSSIHDALTTFPARELDAPAYLPIDRVFALPGHGTIVTGTLMQGRIKVGDVMKLSPSDKSVRVRSLQSFGEKHERLEGGARAAVNLPGVGVQEIARGEMLTAPELASADTFVLTFEALPEAVPFLRRRNQVRAYIGSAEILGTLVFESVPTDCERVRGELFLRRPTVAYPGTAVVLRRLSPKTLLGGGNVQIGNAAAAASDVSAGSNEHLASLMQVLRSRGLAAYTRDEIARDANLREDAVEAAIVELLERGEILSVQRPSAFIDAAAANELLAAVDVALRESHRKEPWSMGATSLALSRDIHVPEALLMRVLDAFADEGRIARRSGYYAVADHTPRLSAEQQAVIEAHLAIDPAQPFVPVPLAAVLAEVKRSRVAGIGKAFDTLLAKGALVKVGDDLYRGSQIAQIHARAESFLRANERMTMAEFRDMLGTSRKYAVPLLEWFDSRGITVRSGDYRMLRAKRERPV